MSGQALSKAADYQDELCKPHWKSYEAVMKQFFQVGGQVKLTMEYVSNDILTEHGFKNKTIELQALTKGDAQSGESEKLAKLWLLHHNHHAKEVYENLNDSCKSIGKAAKKVAQKRAREAEIEKMKAELAKKQRELDEGHLDDDDD